MLLNSFRILATVALVGVALKASPIDPPPNITPLNPRYECVELGITNFAIVYPVLIDNYFTNNTSISTGDFTLLVDNAPISISTIISATKTSASTGTSTAISTPTPLVQFILQISSTGSKRRQSGATYIGTAGSTISDCSAAVFTLSNSQISSGGELISTNAGVTSQTFVASATVGTINDGFSLVNSILYWTDSSFSNDEALFCVLGSFVLAVFNGQYPTGCTPQILISLPVSDCSVSSDTSSSSSLIVLNSITTAALSVISSFTIPMISTTSMISSSAVPTIPTTAPTSSPTNLVSSSTVGTPSIRSSSVSITSSSTVPTSSTDAFIEGMLFWHNYYRANNNAAAVTWSTTLATYAQNHADQCVFVHSGGPYGENLAEGSYTNYDYYVYLWYHEMSSYSFTSPDISTFSSWGHFSQLVWRDTTTIGCGWSTACPENYLVCEYSPPGNLLTVAALDANVEPPQSLTYNIPPTT